MSDGAPACNACSDCLQLAVGALATGASPGEARVDLAKTLHAMRRWHPYLAASDDLPGKRIRAALHAQHARQLADLRLSAVAAGLTGGRRHRLASPRVLAALTAFARLRRRTIRAGAGAPLPGYWRGYLDLIEPRLRGPVSQIYDEEFASAPPHEYSGRLERTRELAAWISEPLPAGARR
jgi:hypothetical protein